MLAICVCVCVCACASTPPAPLWSARGADVFPDNTLTFHGRTFGPYDGIAEPLISADGEHVAFIAERGDQRLVVVDGVESRPFEHVQSGTLRFSPSAAHFAFVGSDEHCVRIVADAAESDCHERVLALSIDDTGHTVAAVRDARRERVLGVPYLRESDGVAELRLSHGHSGWAEKHGERWTAVVDGLAAAECARVRHLRFGDRGRRAAWVCAESGRAAVVVDGVTGAWFPKVSAPVLRDDSPAWAYVGHDAAGAWLVTEDATWGPFGEVIDVKLGPRNVTFVTRSNGATTLVHKERRISLPAVVDGSLSVSEDGEHWALISADPATKTFWFTVDGERVREVSAAEVFGR